MPSLNFLYRWPTTITFWFVFTILSMSCAFFSFYYFPRAFPIVTIDLRMNRSDAIEKSTELAQKYQWGPASAQRTASFQTDSLVKTFIELEAGGKEAFVAMMQNKLYIPYTWQARHFKEFDAREVTVSFTPEGIPYGFVETEAETTSGPNLSSAEAQNIAEKHATQEWHINLSDYTLIEASKELRPNGRGDHIFVYQRPNIRIGEGFYRLRLRVTGDRFTELTHFVQVPEAFLLRYQHMRSANISIASAASMIMTVLYFIVCCIIGLFFLSRNGLVIWRAPLLWGIAVAFLQFLVALNQLPLTWMAYDTALSIPTFLLSYIINNIYALIYSLFSFTITFMAAESLTRKAFGYHLQLWSVWSQKVANSYAILGRTIGGYLTVPFMFAYIVILYAFAQKFFGWWTPSEQLLDPDILSHYAPWFSSLAISLKAGFWEEALFRAVPLATAALLGARFGKKNWWIATAFILQAVIFGAAHANYAAQPAYARIIELIMPSFLFGGIYLLYGLLPAVITHIVYDVVWFALPLFISAAPNAFVNQLLIIIFSLIPLYIICYRWLQSKRWYALSATPYNSAWTPTHQLKAVRACFESKKVAISAFSLYTLLVCGSMGLLAYIYFTPFTQHAPRLTTYRNDVKVSTPQQIKQRYHTALTEPWTSMHSFHGSFKTYPSRMQHRFIWQQGGVDLYSRYLGTYLMPPYWFTRFVKFTGPLIERAEEYQVYTAGNNTLIRTRHQLTETAVGEDLTEEQARIIVQSGLHNYFSLDHTQLKEISAISYKKPARKDWLFEFADEKHYPLAHGQARIAIVISGNIITDAYRYIHIPEEWERNERKHDSITYMISTLCNLAIYVIFMISMSVALIQWSVGHFWIRSFFFSFIGIFILFMGSLAISWPQMVAQFITSEPFINQLFRTIGFGTIQLLIQGTVIALVIALTCTLTQRSLFKSSHISFISGICTGLFITGIYAILQYLSPRLEPLWAHYALSTAVPFIAPTIYWVKQYVIATVLYLLLCNLINHIVYQWHRYGKISYLLLIVFTLVIIGLEAPTSITFWLISGSALGIMIATLYHFIIRFDHTIIPLIMGVIIASFIMQQALFNAYPYAMLGQLSALWVIGLIAWYWHMILRRTKT